MLSTLIKKASETTTPIAEQALKTYYATYTVTDQESTHDNSKVSHPTIVRESCENEACGEKNCSRDDKSCDYDTTKTEMVGHLTHSQKGVTETDRTAYELNADEKTFGVVDDKYKEVNSPYEGFKYNETKMVQDNENTKLLNEATFTKNKKNQIKNDEDKDK